MRITEDEIINLLHVRPASKGSEEIINRKLKSAGIESFRLNGKWAHYNNNRDRNIEHSSGFIIWFGVDACGYIFKAYQNIKYLFNFKFIFKHFNYELYKWIIKKGYFNMK